MNLPFQHQKCRLLSEFTTFGIGGPARYLAEARTKEEMQEMLSYSYQNSIPTFILGKGSNTLFDDRGFNGLVILNKIDYLHQDAAMFTVGAGYGFARLGGLTAKLGWSGLEFASGIPATVGGAIFMNAGANGKETADTLERVEYISAQGEMKVFKKNELTFSYRSSSFQAWGGAIVEGSFCLKELVTAKKEQKTLLSYRLKTQPYGEKSAGCAFRNPQGCAAGKLIEECGLKGKRVGGAAISDLHGNFVVNQGGATAQDVLHLIQAIKETVLSTKQIELEEEIRYIAYE